MKKRFIEEQIITILREAETGVMPVEALCKRRRPGFSSAWKTEVLEAKGIYVAQGLLRAPWMG